MLRNIFYSVIGIGFLFLAKLKHIIQGYQSKRFNISQTQECIDYDIKVVDEWLSLLQQYNDHCSVEGKNILELGPGDDLGVGLYLLSKGAAQYDACDVHDLMQFTPDSFYEQFFDTLKHTNPQADLEPAKTQLTAIKQGKDSKLNYKVRHDFDIVAAFGQSSVDLVFSQAAFECFENIEQTARQLSQVCKTGAIIIAEIDLKTHTRWICDQDPNFIYRYPKWLYNLFAFKGIPNRLRPYQYKAAFEQAGWTDISIMPLGTFDVEKSYSGMQKEFLDAKNQMEYVCIAFCARKA